MANCDCKCSCVGVSLVVSLIIGIIAAFLSFTAVITVTPAFLWVVLGIAVVYLAILLITSPSQSSAGIRGCCPILRITLAGILGAVLTSLILLGIAFASASVIGAIITGLLIAFLSLIITSVVCLILCKSRCRTGDRD